MATTELPVDPDDQEPFIIRLDHLTSDGDATKRPKNMDRSKPATPAQITKYQDALASELTIKFPIAIPADSNLPQHYALLYIPRRDKSKNDFHLWGHPKGKSFDSIVQFARHVRWLVKRDAYYVAEGDEDADVAEYVEVHEECECRLCKV